MLSQIQRFGGAMFTPVLLFPFAGIVVGLAILLQNPMFVGESLTDPNSLFAQIVHIIEEGGWTVFRMSRFKKNAKMTHKKHEKKTNAKIKLIHVFYE